MADEIVSDESELAEPLAESEAHHEGPAQVALPSDDPVSIADLGKLAKRAETIVNELRKRMLLPEEQKTPPMLSGEKVASLCGLTKGQMVYRLRNGAPTGHVTGRGGRREFTVAEAQSWSRTERAPRLRPENALAAVIGVAFFKGGVTKTTTSMVLAQGLSLLGHKVLCIDLDPQGSLTTLFGLSPGRIEDAETLGPLFEGRESDVRYCVRQTYWPGVDLIPSSSSLFASEFILPSRQVADKTFRFWEVLNVGLESVRSEYDVILIDTPPALSYMTINAFFAADGMLVPMTPNMLDVASSAQFWSLFHDFADNLSKRMPKPKTYDFVNVLLSRVNNQESATQAVREWILAVYGPKVLTVEIPVTTVTSGKVNEFSTAYDVSKYEGDYRTYKRARESYETLALTVEELVQRVWRRQLAQES